MKGKLKLHDKMPKMNKIAHIRKIALTKKPIALKFFNICTCRLVARGCNGAVAPQSRKNSTIAPQTKVQSATGNKVIM